jgi:ABC-type transporter Mla subunit MlaD
VDAGRRRWLETLAAACERVLANEDAADTTDSHLAALRDDVARLLSRLRAELDESGTTGPAP